MKKFRKVMQKIFSVLGFALLIILIAVVIVMFDARISGEAPSVFGHYIFRVSSESMEPVLMVGDVILVKSATVDDIKKGDIVTYMGEEGSFAGKMITHKMLEDPQYDDGRYVFKSSGVYDGATPDPEWHEDQLIGEYVKTLPFVDKVYNFFLTPYGLVAFIVVIMVLFGYELIALILSYKNIDEEYVEEEKTEKKDSE